MMAAGCMCPTAPNTLFSYPFRNVDPFVMPHLPNCFVACDQPQFETSRYSIVELSKQTESYFERANNSSNNNDNDNNNIRKLQQSYNYTRQNSNDATDKQESKEEMVKEDDNGSKEDNGIRLICVPGFYRTGTLVLVDVNSATLGTTMIDFSI